MKAGVEAGEEGSAVEKADESFERFVERRSGEFE